MTATIPADRLTIPAGWSWREPNVGLPDDDMEPLLLVESDREREAGVTLEFFDYVDGDGHLHHLVEVAKDTDIQAYAEYVTEGDGMLTAVPQGITEVRSPAWWAARAGTYVDTLALAKQVWPA